MIQAIGLTSTPRKDLPPAVDDVSFEAHAGHVTALLGASGAGKTTALRLMLELQTGRGITYFRGRPLHRIAHPAREVGVLLGDVPGHPARTVRGQLRMLCAAAGVPVRRADEVLEAVGLVGLRDERLGNLSRGMDRRLGLACALLADPHALVLDDPAAGLSAREGRWLHGALRAHAAQGGTVLFTTADPKEAARAADHVVTLDRGRLVADQPAADFARTRLRPRVAVRSPHAARLGALLAKEARTAQRSVEIVQEDGNRLSVYGSTCADIGEAAFRHGILVHQLADEIGDMGPNAGVETAAALSAGTPEPGDLSPLSPPVDVRSVPSPLRPLRYELRRAAGIGTGYATAAAVLVTSVLLAVLLARAGHTPQHRLLAAWPQQLPLPPAALGAGLLGAHAFGDEFRHPALAAARGTVSRRLGLLAAKLLVAGATALALAILAAVCDLVSLHILYGREAAQVPADWLPLAVSWCGLVAGCAWAGVLAAGLFRSTTAGLAAVLTVPVVVVPLVEKALAGPSVRTATGLAERMPALMLLRWPFGGDRYLAVAVRMIAQPVGGALTLSLSALLCAYLIATLRSRVR
ncbi:ABC transporter ATP-binding protein [Streptomyces sp. NPDC003758]|uniref:ABC transporter ATP-binding protein n=1 Tax=Streptomyces cynarae TaxID=2981134 RepID=A0ABY6E908_9ACTN|nr:ABC transporter ATP-binding protein [Streptomyces cynarae]UXY22388.1 ABC transporter ATP-binding protein [Streptomyces cynarae]